MLQLRLVRGKTIVFANSVDKCYRLRLVLDAFRISCVVLNAEMPAASRNHIVTQFNAGRYDLLLASDEDGLEGTDAAALKAETRAAAAQQQQKSGKRRGDDEFKISRGIDFHRVANVINFDVPRSVASYVHRVGRTARVNQKGQALVLVTMRDADRFAAIDDALSADSND